MKYYKKIVNDELKEIGFADEIPDGSIEISESEHVRLHALIEEMWLELVAQLEAEANGRK